MISFKAIGGKGGVPIAQTVKYHEKSFQEDKARSGVDTYYVNERSEMMWQGKGAAILGLQGEPVYQADFRQALEGVLRNRRTGEIIDLQAGTNKQRRAGIDYTFAPPKSVSLVGLVGGDQRVLDACARVNQRMLSWVERHAAMVRIKEADGRNVMVNEGNLLIGTVGHVTNRENEPQIHYHNVIVAAVYSHQQGKWRSLTNDSLLDIRMSADQMAMTMLARELQQLGYGIDYDAQGRWEVRGFNREQIEAFSTRHQAMKSQLELWGIAPDAANFEERQNAVLTTIKRKDELDRDDLQRVWDGVAQLHGMEIGAIVQAAREQSAALGLDSPVVEQKPVGERSWAEIFAAYLGKPRARSDTGYTLGRAETKEATPEVIQAVMWAMEHLAEREQSFPAWQLEATTAAFSRDKFDPEQISTAIYKLQQDGVLLENSHNDGKTLLTTARAVQAEHNILKRVREGRGKGQLILGLDADFNGYLRAFEQQKSQEVGREFRLSFEQQQAARAILSHPDQFLCIQGDAGTGKSALLEFVNQVATEQDWKVMGISITGDATRNLEVSSKIPSQTLASFLYQRNRQETLLEAEIKQLRGLIEGDLSAARYHFRGEVLRPNDHDRPYGKAQYLLQHHHERMFRGPDSLRQRLGVWLSRDVAIKKSQAQERVAHATNPIKSAWAIGNLWGREKQQEIGRALTQFRRVDLAEAIAARSAALADAPKSHWSKPRLRDLLRKREQQYQHLQATGNIEGRPMLWVIDEASMAGALDASKVMTLASAYGARLAFPGDRKQHGSVPAGRYFEQLQASGIYTACLSETRRFDHASPAVQRAAKLAIAGEFAKALDKLPRVDVQKLNKGKQPDERLSLAQIVADRYVFHQDRLRQKGLENPLVNVVVMINEDRKSINQSVHERLQDMGRIAADSVIKGHLDDPKLTGAQARFTEQLSANGINALIFNQNYRKLGVQSGDVVKVLGYDQNTRRVQIENGAGLPIWFNPRQQDHFTPARLEERAYAVGDRVVARFKIRDLEVINGTQGRIVEANADGLTIAWADGKQTLLNNEQAKLIDHGYAYTTVKEQGASTDVELLASSQKAAWVFNKQAALVALTRSRGDAEVITEDFKNLKANSMKEPEKTTAIEVTPVAAPKQNARFNLINLTEALINAVDKLEMPVTVRQSQQKQDKAISQEPVRQTEREQDHGLWR